MSNATTVRAEVGDAPRIEGLLHDYLRELSAFGDPSPEAADPGGYPYLDAYWAEPGRHPFLIQCDGRTVGFSFIRGPTSTGTDFYEVAEFYVVPANRRSGIGRSAVFSIWEELPGRWELQVHTENGAAMKFWSSCVREMAVGTPEVSEVQASDGLRLRYRFSVRGAV